MEKKKQINVFQDVTDRVIEKLKEGVAPWQRGWKDSGMSGILGINAPRNYETKKAYSGINILLLGMAGFDSPWWLPYKALVKMGGNVAGQKGTRIVRWFILYFDENNNKIPEKDVRAGKPYHKKAFFPKYHTVFNAEQISGIDFPEVKKPEVIGDVELTNDPIENVEAILDAYENPPTVKFDGRNPCYVPRTDCVHMPDINQYKSSEAFYKDYMHEHMHGTGAESRLGRKGIVEFDKFGSEQYAREELIAELGASFMAEIAGFSNEETIEDTASYCKSWIKKLQDDPKMITYAMSGAQKAVEHILGGELHPVLEDKEEAVKA